MSFTAAILTAPAENFWFGIVLSAALGIFCFYRAFNVLRHSRIIEDTPTSKIRSAAQGYTELEGIAELLDGEPIVAPLSLSRCVWYSVRVEERVSDVSAGGSFSNVRDLSSLFRRHSGDQRWSTIRSEISDSIFRLRDDTGDCIVDPDFASVNPKVSITWYGDHPNPSFAPSAPPSWLATCLSRQAYRYTEKRIHGGDPVYVIGQFLTLGTDHHSPTVDSEIRDLLRRWKENQVALLQRFDLNRDGQIDAREWEIARKVARKTVEKNRRAELNTPTSHVVRKPVDSDLPFIISADLQQSLLKKQRISAGIYFLVFFVAVTLCALSLQIRVLGI